MSFARLLAVFLALTCSACAHHVASRTLTEAQLDDRIFSLEDDFWRFVGTDLEDDLALEAAVGDLQRLRLRYLFLLDQPLTEAQNHLVLCRIAELHLDLAARGRRIAYPDDGDRAGFDRHLSQMVAPLEAAGLGILEQLAEDRAYADEIARFISARASLYLSLHKSHRLGAAAGEHLRRELAPRSPRLLRVPAAPSRLLEIGRVGQRAARTAH